MTSGTQSIDFDEERMQVFPTRVLRRRYEGLDNMHRTLQQLILDRESTGPALSRSNVGGWHSQTDLLRWESPAITVLTALLQDAVHHHLAWLLDRPAASIVANMALEAWANVVREGHYHQPHVHPGSHFALTYYVDAGDDVAPAPGAARPTSGVLELMDPTGRPNMLPIPGHPQPDTVAIKPQTGLLVLFPAWMHHFVHAYRGSRPRISVACNVTVKEVREVEP